MDVEAYPLQWPVTWQRTEKTDRQDARFATPFSAARDSLLLELGRMGVERHEIVISTNVALRKDGLPYATRQKYDDPGVAVYFMYNGRQVCIPCDRWTRVEDNLQAIRKTVEAIRGLERWGAGKMVDAAFDGFTAIPATSETDGWWTVLGVPRDADYRDIVAAWKGKVRETHPDTGGDREAFLRVQEAYQQAMIERR